MNRLFRKYVVGFALVSYGLAAAAGEAAGRTPTATVPEQGWFLGVGFGAADYSDPNFSTNSLSYLYLQGGWRFNRYLAVDARVATNLPGGGCGCGYGYYYNDPFQLRVQSLYGAYLRLAAPLSPHWDLYALAGYASLSLEANAYAGFASSTAESASFGLGASWKFERFAVDLELLPTLANGEGWRTDALNLGFHYQF
jgi:hypothetical protein